MLQYNIILVLSHSVKLQAKSFTCNHHLCPLLHFLYHSANFFMLSTLSDVVIIRAQ
jgi:hypothetical protein